MGFQFLLNFSEIMVPIFTALELAIGSCDMRTNIINHRKQNVALTVKGQGHSANWILNHIFQTVGLWNCF